MLGSESCFFTSTDRFTSPRFGKSSAKRSPTDIKQPRTAVVTGGSASSLTLHSMADSEAHKPVVGDQVDTNEDVAQNDLDLTADNDIEATNDETATQPMNVDGADDMPGVPSDQEAAANADAAPVLETRIPAKKDASLREFLDKMDDYAPIVCFRCHTLDPSLLIHPKSEPLYLADLSANLPRIDSRRGDKLLPHPRRSSPAPSNLPQISPPPRPRDPEIHRRHRRRRVPVQSDQVHQHDVEQSLDRVGRCCGVWHDAWCG